MDTKYQIFRPTLTYWLKNWVPVGLIWCFVVTVGIQQNVGTATSNRAIGFSVFSILIFTGLVLITARQHIILTPHGLFVQTFRTSYFWPWEQIDAVHIYATGEESKPNLLVSTEAAEHKFAIHAFDEAELEDAITTHLDSELIGLGAYQQTERYKASQEAFELELKRLGETKRYVGGPVNGLLYWYALLTGIAFFSAFILLAKANSWLLAVPMLCLAIFGFIRPLSLSGNFYMNRDHIICKRPWQTHMMWWRDVVSVEISFRYIVFRGGNQCLVAPGLLFWGGKAAKRLDRILTQQINERRIFAQPTDLFSFPRNKNVRTKRFD